MNPDADRRAHRRYELACPAQLFNTDGETLGGGKTRNLSDGGLLVPLDAPVEPGTSVSLCFSLPRQTPNSYLLEHVAGEGRVVRVEPDQSARCAAAIAFDAPMDLKIEV
jgi:hypothetical protein